MREWLSISSRGSNIRGHNITIQQWIDLQCFLMLSRKKPVIISRTTRTLYLLSNFKPLIISIYVIGKRKWNPESLISLINPRILTSFRLLKPGKPRKFVRPWIIMNNRTKVRIWFSMERIQSNIPIVPRRKITLSMPVLMHMMVLKWYQALSSLD